MPDAPFMTRENRFAVPPEYAFAWLTDFREDDDKRLVGGKDLVRVRKDASGIHRESATPMGPFRTTTVLASPRWTTRGEQLDRKGRLMGRWDLEEWVETDGAGGTRHHVRITKPRDATLRMRLMLPLMRPMMKRQLDTLFTNAKAMMEAQHRAGKPPTA